MNNPNTEPNTPRIVAALTTLRDLRRVGAIDQDAETRLKDFLEPTLQNPIDIASLTEIGTKRLMNLRRVITSAPHHSLIPEDLSKLDEIIRVTRAAEARIPKPIAPQAAMPSRRRLFGIAGGTLVALAILVAGGYEVQRATRINEVEKRGREIMGRDFFGADAIDKTFGIRLPVEKMPKIPFDQIELQRAKELDQFLILRTDVGPNNIPLTEGAMNWIFAGQNRDIRDFEGAVSRSYWRVMTDTPRPGWALVSRKLLHGSLNQSYLQQIEILTDYLINGIFKSRTAPAIYAEAINEFEKQKPVIKSMISSRNFDWIELLTSLKIIELTLPRPSEFNFDKLILAKIDNGTLLENSLSGIKPKVTSEGRIIGGYLTDIQDIHNPIAMRPDGSTNNGRGVRLSRLQ